MASRGHTGATPPPVDVDVTRDNFEAVLPTVSDALSRCEFFALDCEMTGLFTDEGRHQYLDDMQDRYLKVQDSARSFVITQFGLSAFERTGPASYQARSFNFYLFPDPADSTAAGGRKFLCDAGSLAFLAAQGFDFNKCITQGVPFTSVRTRDYRVAQAERAAAAATERAAAAAAANGANGEAGAVSGAADVALKEPADVEFVQQLVELVRAWLHAGWQAAAAAGGSEPHDGQAAAADAAGGGSAAGSNSAAGEGGANGIPTADGSAAAAGGEAVNPDELLLPPTNSYRRLLTYQALKRLDSLGVSDVQNPGFYVKKVGGYGSGTPGPPRILLVRGTPNEAAGADAEALQARLADVRRAAGFAAVFEMLRKSRKPAIGHNLMFDLAYSLHSFGEGFLPSTWRDFKAVARSWFPGGIWDTKYLARCLPQHVLGGSGGTALAELYAALPGGGASAVADAFLAAAGGSGSGLPPALPSIQHAPGFTKYSNVEASGFAHEAGYDAFMTGAVFACLLPLLDAQQRLNPACEVAKANAAADMAGAAAATAARAPPSSPLGPANGASLASPAAVAAAVAAVPGALHTVRGLVGRLNITRSDIAYSALWPHDPDPEPQRPCVFHVSGLQPGYRVGDLYKMLQRTQLGKARVTQSGSTAALVEVDAAVQPFALQALRGMAPGVSAQPWADFQRERYVQLDGGGGRSASSEEGGEGESAGEEGGGGEANVRAGEGWQHGGGLAGSKRPRLLSAEEAAGDGGGSKCSLM